MTAANTERGRLRRAGARPLMLLAILACGFGLSASALEHADGYFLAATDGAVAEPVTRLVYAGPMPDWEEPADVAALTKDDIVIFDHWPRPVAQIETLSLPQIPEYELFSEAKVATLRGQPILADFAAEPVEAAEPVVTVEPGAVLNRPFMTVLPKPALAVPEGLEAYCDGFC